MGREIKRVALDFKPEIGKVWEGFLNPHYRHCPHCKHGTTTGRSRLEDLVSLLMLSGTDARSGRAHPYLYDAPLYSTSGHEAPSRDLGDLTAGLAGREPSSMGHDACDRYSAVKKIIAVAGMSEDWGICPSCKGDAVGSTVKEVYEAWTETPPPSGDGYQLWETTSEGSPLTPVFATPEELARYCSDNRVSSFGAGTESYSTWLKFIKGPAWAPSMVMQGGKIQSGVEAATGESAP